MIRIVQYAMKSITIFLCILAVSCDSSEKAPMKSQEQQVSKSSVTTPESSTGAQQLSTDARSCLDLVKSKAYAEAIKPCQRAIQETSSAEVTQAYEKAKAEVKKAAESATMDAAQDAASDTLRGLGGK